MLFQHDKNPIEEAKKRLKATPEWFAGLFKREKENYLPKEGYKFVQGTDVQVPREEGLLPTREEDKIEPAEATTEEPTATPTPIAEPTPTLTPNASKHTSKYSESASKHFPNDEVNNALNVMFEESSGNPNAINMNTNGSKDYGLMQINDIHESFVRDAFGYEMEELLDVEKNLEVAGLLFELFGWQPWVGARKLGLAKRTR